MGEVLETVRGRASDLASFSGYVGRRFMRDGCLMGAGALSYTALVSFVPLIAVGLAIFSAFPIFADARDRMLSFIFTYFVPEVGDEAAWWFKWFATSAAQTTALGVLALGFTALLLLATIEDQLQAIWRIARPRPLLQRILVYWTLLTLGPLLIGASLSLSGYFDMLARSAGIDPDKVEHLMEGWFHGVARAMPLLLVTVALTLTYSLVPNTKVRWREAFLGAVVASATIELLKFAFRIYLTRFSTYRNVYGALAAIPIFLFWMYVSWGAVLLGAVVAAALPQWRVDEGLPRVPAGGRQLGVSLALLGALAECAREGGRLTTKQLADLLGLGTGAVEEHLGPLQEARFVAPTADGAWVLARATTHTTLFDLYEALKLPLAGKWREGEAEASWQQRVAHVMQRVSAAEAEALCAPLSTVLAELPEPKAEPTPLRKRQARGRAGRHVPDATGS
jgi:membrane protein